MIQSSLSKRQGYILEVVSRAGPTAVSRIIQDVSLRFDTSSRITVLRDLNILINKKLIRRKGEGRGVKYESTVPFLLQGIDLDNYFSKGPDQRIVQKLPIDFSKKNTWGTIVDAAELGEIHERTKKYQHHIKKYNSSALAKELQRITVEFSWKSSHIEGNTYTLLDTEHLIIQKQEAPGKKHEEAVMILNHKTALEYAWNHSSYFKRITIRKIEELHDLIVADLGIKKGIRKHPVGIIGTAYKPYDNSFQIRESLEDMCVLINKIKEPFIKAIIAVAGLSYLQPFEDGNKRSSRLLGNALLLAYNYCPLSYRSIDEVEYKKAIILFYEQHTLFAFKKLFIEQYEFAINNYFR